MATIVGLEIFDASGNLTLRVTDRLTRVAGTVYTGNADGFIAVPVFATVAQSARWATIVDFEGGGQYAPIFTLANEGLYWTFRGNRFNAKNPSWVTYGVF